MKKKMVKIIRTKHLCFFPFYTSIVSNYHCHLLLVSQYLPVLLFNSLLILWKPPLHFNFFDNIYFVDSMCEWCLLLCLAYFIRQNHIQFHARFSLFNEWIVLHCVPVFLLSIHQWLDTDIVFHDYCKYWCRKCWKADDWILCFVSLIKPVLWEWGNI